MKFESVSCVMLLVFVLWITVPAQQVAPNISELSWMAGCWAMDVPERKLTVEEHWLRPAGGMMIGVSRTVRDEKATEFEFLRIVSTSTGIEYVARPSENKEETAFKLVTASASQVTFENLGHDFPQRIIYKFGGQTALTARVEGLRSGKTTGFDLTYKRVKCD